MDLATKQFVDYRSAEVDTPPDSPVAINARPHEAVNEGKSMLGVQPRHRPTTETSGADRPQDISTPEETPHDEDRRPLVPTPVHYETGPVSCWNVFPQCANNTKKLCRIIIIVALGIFLMAGIIAGATTVFNMYRTMTSQAVLLPGSVVELQDVQPFWYNKVAVTEKRPKSDEDKMDANIYFVHNCASKAKVNTTNLTSRYLPFTKPDGVDGFDDNSYFLRHTNISFEVFVDPQSDFTHPIKICQFPDKKAIDALTAAETISEVNDAEEKGKCFKMNTSSHNITETLIEYSIGTHGYYYYAVSVFVDPDNRNTKNVNLSYSYTLRKYYYDKNDFTPENCSVVDDECSKTGLTIDLNTLCVLAYIPVPPTEQEVTYSFTVTQSWPCGIIITTGGIILLIIIIYGILGVTVLTWGRLRRTCNRDNDY